jgi:GH15 family glucan-1,4-alpha-glucosidase
MPYLPIEHHGVIGDLHTVALVGTDGTLDWLCLPHFDSPSVFASILDDERGGGFRIAAASPDARRRQMYLPDTNVLMTRFLTPDGVGEVVDFMPLAPRSGSNAGGHRVVRLVRGVRGDIPFTVSCRPALDYGRAHAPAERTGGGWRWSAGEHVVHLATPLDLRGDGAGVAAEFTLHAGDEIPFVVTYGRPGAPEPEPASVDRCRDAFRETVRFWQSWIARGSYQGRWREMVKRSCLVLKMLTFAPTGAIVAAPTASLPESIGGKRNWDYRYNWIRDAAFTVFAFIRAGFADEAAAFIGFVEARCRELAPGEALRVLYGIDGRRELPEDVLDHLDGYKGSRPVRIGNDAAGQLQLDITGELIDALYLFDKHCRPIPWDVWLRVCDLADWICGRWTEPDEGIWEVRNGPRPFTFSKMMCWVALDRANRIAVRRSLPGNRERWVVERDKIYETIMARGWSTAKRSFVQELDGEALDASMLLAPMVKFVAPDDPRMLGTLDAIRRELVSDGLVHRYDPTSAPDGVGGAEGTLSMCTFWYAEALARAGHLEQARLTFEKMLGYANHLGLYSEEIAATGEALGNFPQAFTHLGLVSAAINIDRALDGHPGRPLHG